MKTSMILAVLVLAGVLGVRADVVDRELIASPVPTSNAYVSVRVDVAGHVEAVFLDVASGSTGDVLVAVSNRLYTAMPPRTLTATNNIMSDLWDYPSDGASRRFAVTPNDVFGLIVSNSALLQKQYRAVIRIETSK